MGVKVSVLTTMRRSVIFIDALCAQLHIFKETTRQKLMFYKKHEYEYDQNRLFSGIINGNEIA